MVWLADVSRPFRIGPANPPIANRLTRSVFGVPAVTGLLVALPIIVDLLANGATRVFFYFAGDTFYYLTVARNFGHTGQFTFDQEHPTNGFHPLWQILTGLLYRAANMLALPDGSWEIVLVLLVSLLLVATSMVVLGAAFIRCRGRVPLSFVLLPIGYGLLTFPAGTQYNSAWSFVNGMESGPVLLSYALIAMVAVDRNFLSGYRQALLTGGLLTLLFYSRLDHVLFGIALLGLVLVRSAIRRNGAHVRYALVAGGVLALGMLGYFAFSLATAGVLMPVSGASKTTFPSPVALLDNTKNLLSLLHTLTAPDAQERLYRFAQILVPMVAALVYLSAYVSPLVRRRWHGFSFLLAATALFVLGYGGYNLAFVPLWNQGSWYFPVSTLFVSLCFVLLVDVLLERLLSRISPDWGGFAQVVMLVGFAVLVLGWYTLIYHNGQHNAVYTTAYGETFAALRGHYAGQAVKLIEMDDGIIGYATGYHTLSGFGFTLDKHAAEAAKDGRLLDLAYQRGYRYLSTLYYPWLRGLTHSSTSGEIRARLIMFYPHLREAELHRFDYRVDFVSPDGLLVVVTLQPADQLLRGS